MERTFPYLKRHGQNFPIIEVSLSRNKNELRVLALVDSGASFSVFRSEIADYLGITIENGNKIYLTGIAGRILGYLHKVDLSIGTQRFSCKVVFSPELTISFNLLGRDNFFAPFVISFHEKRQKLILVKQI